MFRPQPLCSVYHACWPSPKRPCSRATNAPRIVHSTATKERYGPTVFSTTPPPAPPAQLLLANIPPRCPDDGVHHHGHGPSLWVEPPPLTSVGEAGPPSPALNSSVRPARPPSSDPLFLHVAVHLPVQVLLAPHLGQRISGQRMSGQGRVPGGVSAQGRLCVCWGGGCSQCK